MNSAHFSLARLRAYIAHPDPLAGLANTVALLVASNQPFYPLYVWWLVSEDITPVYYTFLSTPFFLAVPALVRRNSIAGRALLPLAGIGNGVMCAKLFGIASGVELFLIPCGVLAMLLFRPGERVVSYTLCGIALLAYMLLHERYGAPAIDYNAAQYQAFFRLNALSATALTVLVALMFSNLMSRLTEPTGDKKPD